VPVGTLTVLVENKVVEKAVVVVVVVELLPTSEEVSPVTTAIEFWL